jgi:hypothetical protein
MSCPVYFVDVVYLDGEYQCPFSAEAAADVFCDSKVTEIFIMNRQTSKQTDSSQ